MPLITLAPKREPAAPAGPSVRCPRCQRLVALAPVGVDGTAGGRCACGAEVMQVETTGEDGLLLQQVVVAQRRATTRRGPQVLARFRRLDGGRLRTRP